jgi:N-acetylneuraminic acid mutarotase
MRVAAVVMALTGGIAGSMAAQPSPSSPATAGWTIRAPMPSVRLETAAAVLDGRVYVVGGLAADGTPLDIVEVYDPATDTWATGPDHPVVVHHAMAAVLDGALYVAGGYGTGGAATRRVHRLSPEGWRPVARLPLARAAGTMVALGGRLLLAGGVDLGGDPGREMLAYEPTTDAWSVIDGPPTPREHLAGAVVDGGLLTVGGRISGVHVGTVEAWDPVAATWQATSDLPTPRAGLGATATCDGVLVAIGGEDIRGVADGTFSEVEAWDPLGGTWSRLPDLPTGRHGLGVVAVGSSVLVIGGGTEAGLSASDTVLALDLAGRPGCGGTGGAP